MTPNRIIEQIFGQPGLHQVDEAALEKLVAKYPYFSAARLLLAKKDYSHHEDLHRAAVKTALLYSAQPHHAYHFVTSEPVLQEVEERVAAVIPADEIDPAPLAVADFEAAPVQHNGTAEVTTAPVPVPDTLPEAAASMEEEALHEAIPVADETPLYTPAPDHDTPEETPEETGPIKIFPLELPAEEETVLTFQPLYTDDYFAYKRLKNPGEADELNEQGAAEMKSFTSWLRQIKDNFTGKTNKDWYHQQLHRLYEEDEEPEVSETVEKMAMDSITLTTDIVSETLAEIWVKQQRYEHAIQIYQKLSLLNPDKNAYFAQKIKELKSQTDKK
ncbi:hypothetical protein [Chitinophaga vietnamensis]|uniref:hypothetical protein n=1 Tax=Chitinophaga vietnamensis TaxID=2593957 RepID=UPI00117765EF|nr:hypothetical protein [Chitinophaga vietnamensis]